MHNINLKNVGGYAYKTVTIGCEAGTLKYEIATQSNLGLPEGAIVFGIGYRIGSPGSKSINNRDLANFAFIQDSFLTLRDCETKEIFANVPLYDAVEFGPLKSSVLFFEPRLVGQIDWERSFVTIPQNYAAQVKDDTDLELVLLYFDPACAKDVQGGHEDRTGFKTGAENARMLEIIQRTGVQNYSFAKNSTIGIPSDAIVIGIGLYPYGNVVYTGSTFPADSDKSFITLKRGTTIFVDSLPIEFGKSINLPSMQKQAPKYFPLQPTLAGQIDWEGSQFRTLNPTDGASCVFVIYFVKPIFK